MNCQEAVNRLYELLDQELTPAVQNEVRTHFETCRRCFPLYTFERNFKRFLEARTRVSGAPPHLRRQIFEQILLEDERSED
jgi:anti-sigma factor (TIGR02949 family)